MIGVTATDLSGMGATSEIRDDHGDERPQHQDELALVIKYVSRLVDQLRHLAHRRMHRQVLSWVNVAVNRPNARATRPLISRVLPWTPRKSTDDRSGSTLASPPDGADAGCASSGRGAQKPGHPAERPAVAPRALTVTIIEPRTKAGIICAAGAAEASAAGQKNLMPSSTEIRETPLDCARRSRHRGVGCSSARNRQQFLDRV
jgi:hypothetical protein